ncbi:MAG: hypothetical protein A2X13_06195 [Bacteroidetes bacterium GWC2_33_15]|nr:MAG: hypothetical protein A2X10_03565 [Bacteroidetes bacterium GWA2_33_15]OFX51814.1 MAG: hypothetical protein A2X13_06195 [Bacteroidetes bacterium GWC2_33_15]OFX66814.1 MAG: hypothetical protein A2X15_08930 [Bacteroidetes bacterium GWB2_32_14]OFX67072.1 MAG: hypothetical protein A2X14_10435 [Bacteroidetes bacterium GWD2_33_33]HAN17162.1 hypothetical protein [Bacteroidales bacterium]
MIYLIKITKTNYMKIFIRNLLIISLLLFASKLFSQESEEKKIDFKLSGFIRTDFYYDSRQNAEALEGLLHIYPKDISLDANSKDQNAQSSVGLVDIASRITGQITGPDVFGAKLLGYLEVDFTGGIDGFTSRVRLRNAYSKLTWEKSEILIGRDWHPMFTKEVFPTVLSINTGLPFNAFNRSPMLFAAHKIGQFRVIGAVIYQSDYANSGPDGKSAKYLKNSGIPNLHLQLQYNPGEFLFGVAADYKCIQPRISVDTSITSGTFYVADEKLNSYAWMGYFKYQQPKLVIKGKAVYGQNLSESIMPGGYGVSSIDSITGTEKYTPFNHLYLWANVVYGDKFKVGIFGGYTRNYGANDNLIDKKRNYGMALDISYLYRIAPTVTYRIKNFQLGLELEYTVAAYGTNDLEDYGKVKDTHEVSNTRVLFSVSHYF